MWQYWRGILVIYFRHITCGGVEGGKARRRITSSRTLNVQAQNVFVHQKTCQYTKTRPSVLKQTRLFLNYKNANLFS